MLVLALAAIAIAQDAVTNTYDVDGSTVPTAKGIEEEAGPDRHQLRLLGRRGPGSSPVAGQEVLDPLLRHPGQHERRPRLLEGDARQRGPRRLQGQVHRRHRLHRERDGQPRRPERPVGRLQREALGHQPGRPQGEHLRQGQPRRHRPAREVRDRARRADPGAVRAQEQLHGARVQRAGHAPASAPDAEQRGQARPVEDQGVTKRIKGKTRGYYEAIGGCKNGGRAIEVVFTPEEGAATTAQHKAKC